MERKTRKIIRGIERTPNLEALESVNLHIQQIPRTFDSKGRPVDPSPGILCEYTYSLIDAGSLVNGVSGRLDLRFRGDPQKPQDYVHPSSVANEIADYFRTHSIPVTIHGLS